MGSRCCQYLLCNPWKWLTSPGPHALSPQSPAECDEHLVSSVVETWCALSTQLGEWEARWLIGEGSCQFPNFLLCRVILFIYKQKEDVMSLKNGLFHFENLCKAWASRESKSSNSNLGNHGGHYQSNISLKTKRIYDALCGKKIMCCVGLGYSLSISKSQHIFMVHKGNFVSSASHNLTLIGNRYTYNSPTSAEKYFITPTQGKLIIQMIPRDCF